MNINPKTEQELTKHGQYSYMHDLRGRIDSTMADTTISDFKTFSAVLAKTLPLNKMAYTYSTTDFHAKQEEALKHEQAWYHQEIDRILHEKAG
ncbi:hypothetical protein ABMB44_14030 [Levilactobacillus brevis]